MKRIANVLFDLDGTLTDPKEGITKSIQFALGELGVRSPDADALHWCIGPPLNISFSRLLESSDEALIMQAIAHYRIRFAEVGMFGNKVYPEIPQALERIKALGIRSFVATSKPEVFAIKILEHFNLTSLFESIHGSGLDGTRSDKGELVAHILETEGIDPATALIVGDREHDIFGGRKNKIKTAAVTYGYGSQQEIAAAQPDFVFGAPLELATFLERDVLCPTLGKVMEGGPPDVGGT
jgi:phosphoglycolate phosphatase